MKSFLESGSPLSTLTHTKNGNVGRREEKSKKIFFRRERKGREAQKHHSKNAENQSQGENPGSSPRKMTLHIQGNPTKLTSDFLAKTLEDNGIKYSNLKEKKKTVNQEFYIQQSHLKKKINKNEGKIKTFLDKQKLKKIRRMGIIYVGRSRNV